MSEFAFVFPGQGSQSIGMLNGFVNISAVEQVLNEASDVLNFDIDKLISNGPKELIDLTINTQPIMLTAAIACYRAWVELNGKLPSVMAGHSLGEYSALVASGVMSFKDALLLVKFRANAMQQAVSIGCGGMSAVLGLDAQVVKKICKEASISTNEVVEPANFNSPEQTVIAGHLNALSRAAELAQLAGAKRVVPLSVSGPFHTSLLNQASHELKNFITPLCFSKPSIPVINNVDVKIVESSEEIKNALIRQVSHPVRWTETINKMAVMNIACIVECAPGKTLSGLIRRIDKNIVTEAIGDKASLDRIWKALN